MALIKSPIYPVFKVRVHNILLNCVRHHWNKDYAPGKYPVTEKERDAAAKKYNLHPSEYKPFPDDGTGLGDYPVVPDISGDVRDPFYPWDKPEIKQNFNEPIHVDEDLIDDVHYDVTTVHRIPFWSQWGQFCFAFFGTMGLMYFMERCKMFPAIYPRQYPNKEHYTFELVKEDLREKKKKKLVE